MAGVAQMRTEHVAETPRGWKVRTITPGPDSKHEVRIAFPPGRRRKGSGRVVEILHPAGEKNPKCALSEKARKNPGELLIFGNPGSLEKKRAARDRAARIRAARLNPGLFDAIRPGSRVTIVNRFGQQRTGRAVMRGPGGWVLNMGGAYGTPGIATPENVTKVRAGNPEKGDDKFVCQHCGKEFTAKQVEAGEYRKHIAGHRGKKANPFQRRRLTGRTLRNPSETKKAVRLFQGFHGHDPKEIVEKHVSAATRLDYTVLGDLVYLKVETPVGKKAEFNFHGDGVKLASSPDGKQLYCIGGNQNILPCLDEDSKQKDFIDLGDGIEVAYLARKIQGKFQPVEYYHEFGEVDGTLPRLMYDKLRKQIFFIGGNYWVDVNMPAPGTPLGKISPGIEN